MKKLSLFMAMVMLITTLSACTDSKGDLGKFGRSYTKTVDEIYKSDVIKQTASFSVKMDYNKLYKAANDSMEKNLLKYFVKDGKITVKMESAFDVKNKSMGFKLSAGKMSNLQIWMDETDLYISAAQLIDAAQTIMGAKVYNIDTSYNNKWLRLSDFAPEYMSDYKNMMELMFEQTADYSSQFASGGKILKLIDSYKIISESNKGLEKPVISVSAENMQIDINYSNIDTFITNLETFYKKNGTKFDKSLVKLMNSYLKDSMGSMYSAPEYSDMIGYSDDNAILKEAINALKEAKQIEKLKLSVNLGADGSSKFSFSGKVSGEAIAMTAASKSTSGTAISIPQDMEYLQMSDVQGLLMALMASDLPAAQVAAA